MPEIYNRRDLQIGKKFHSSSKNKKGNYYPAHQIVGTSSLPDLYKIPITSASFGSDAFNNGSTIYFDVEKYEFSSADNIEIKLELSANGGDVEVVPGMYLFDELELITNKGSGDKIGDFIHPMTQLTWNLLTMKDDELKYQQQYQNYSLTEYRADAKYKFGKNDTNIIRDGDSRSIYVKIPFNFIHFKALDFSHIAQPLRIRLKCSNDVVVSGSVNNLSLDNIHLIVESRREEPFDIEHQKSLNNRNNGYIFLKSERITYNNKTITAGSETKFDLQSLVGKCAFLVFCVLPSTAPNATDESLYDFVELGKGATIDLQNASGQSEISAANHNWDTELLEKIFIEKTNNKNIRGLYVLPFNEDLHSSMSGRMNGWYQFYSQRCDLCIKPSANGTSEVHAVNLGVASPDSGSYCFEVNGELSAYIPYSANVALMKSTIEAMDNIKQRGYTVTCSQTAENGLFNITFDQYRDGRVSNNIGLVKVVGNNLNDGGTAAEPTTTLATPGVAGFQSGSNYTMEIYAFTFSEVCIDKNGRITTRDL